MSVANKTRALLNLTNHKLPDLAECLGVSVQAVRNKFSRDSFSVDDLLRICNELDCEISIKTRDGQVVYLGLEDLKDSEKKKTLVEQEV